MSKRYITLLATVVFMFSCIIGRVGYLFFSGVYTVSDTYNSYSLFVDGRDVQLYYFDGSKINNNIIKYVTAIRPVTADLAELHKKLNDSEEQKIVNELREGYPVVADVKLDSLNTIKTYDTETTVSQLISTSSSGLLSYIDKEAPELSINYHIDAKGRLLVGDIGTLDRGEYYARGGYVLTLDKEIQEIAYKAASSVKSGAVIVMNAKNSRILACVSKPDNTYINKSFAQYSVGSVFKIVVAACALENDIDYQYVCKGTCSVGDTSFSCQKERKHGYETLKTALADSCNCYFVNLAQYLGSERIIETAEKLGFGKDFKIFKEWSVKTSVLPTSNDLQSKGELSLLGFGQGKLTASPLQMCSVLCTIASGGYREPSLVFAEKANNGSISEYKLPAEKKVLSDKACKTLLEYLRFVVTDGTGYNAESSSQKSAGKTATAQTGQYHYGREINNAWFAGVYPYDNPRYAIVVLCEDGESGSSDCCPVFRTIVENLDKR